MMNHEYRPSDEVLIEAARRGDENAAARLYHRYIDRVHRICRRIILDSSEVNDCVQEVWIKVFRNLSRYKTGKSFSAWLNSITANTAIDYYRKSVRQGKTIDIDVLPLESIDASKQSSRRQLNEERIQKLIDSALLEISIHQRTAFVLRYFEDMPTLDIARILDCSEGTVRTHIRRSLLALREKLAAKIKGFLVQFPDGTIIHKKNIPANERVVIRDQ